MCMPSQILIDLDVVMAQNRRNIIAELSRAGHSPAKIISLTGYVRRTVYRTVAKLNETGGVERSKHKVRSDLKRTPRFLAGLRRSIKADPSQSMMKLAMKRNVSPKTIANANKNDLGMKSYARRQRNILTAKTTAIRRERCPKLLSHLKNTGGDIRIFVDEKKFVVDEVANRRNSRVIALNLSEVPPVMKSKHPASSMVFGAVASDGRVMPPHFIKAGLKINTEEYLKILKDVLMPWIVKFYDPQRVMFVQDSAPAHGSKKVQKYLKEHLPLFVPKETWPSSSPDLNPCDYWMWSVIEKQSNASPHNSIKSLETSIKRACRSIGRDEGKKACRSFRRRIQEVIDAEGSHIE